MSHLDCHVHREGASRIDEGAVWLQVSRRSKAAPAPASLPWHIVLRACAEPVSVSALLLWHSEARGQRHPTCPGNWRTALPLQGQRVGDTKARGLCCASKVQVQAQLIIGTDFCHQPPAHALLGTPRVTDQRSRSSTVPAVSTQDEGASVVARLCCHQRAVRDQHLRAEEATELSRRSATTSLARLGPLWSRRLAAALRAAESELGRPARSLPPCWPPAEHLSGFATGIDSASTHAPLAGLSLGMCCLSPWWEPAQLAAI